MKQSATPILTGDIPLAALGAELLWTAALVFFGRDLFWRFPERLLIPDFSRWLQ